jgi:hypothetical protein
MRELEEESEREPPQSRAESDEYDECQRQLEGYKQRHQELTAVVEMLSRGV